MIEEKKTITEQVKEAADIVNKSNEVPAGYLEIRLGTHGKYGAPEVFHVRNFSTEDLVHLAISDDSELPQRTIEFLNNIIWEKDIDVSNFHEKEVQETLLRIYKTFYSDKMNNLTWEADDEDKAYIAQKCGGDTTVEYQNKIASLENGSWKPRFDIDLNKVKFYEVDDNVKTQANIYNSRTNFKCIYSWPRYGDVVKIKQYTDVIFKEKDKQFENIQKIAKFRQDAERQLLDGSTINISRVPDITKDDREKLKAYQEEKLNFMTTCMRAIQLKSIRDVDLSTASLSDRVKYAQDPELDFATFKVIQTKFNDELKIGPIEELTVLDPIMNKLVTRSIPFHIFDIISALRDADPDGVTIDFE